MVLVWQLFRSYLFYLIKNQLYLLVRLLLMLFNAEYSLNHLRLLVYYLRYSRKCPHNAYVDTNSCLRPEDATKHSNAVSGESIRWPS